MAGIADTKFAEVLAAEPIEKTVTNRPDPLTGALDLCVKQTNGMGTLLTPEVKKALEQSWGRTPKIYTHYGAEPTLRTTRSSTVIPGQNDSKAYAITFVHLETGFQMAYAKYATGNGGQINRVTYDADMRLNLLKVSNLFKKELEDLILSTLLNSTSEYLEKPIGFEFVANTIIADNAQGNVILAKIPAFLAGNKFPATDVDVLGDVGLMAHFADLEQHGTYNDVDRAAQIAGKNYFFSNRFPSAAGSIANGFFMPEGSVAMVTRLQPEAYANFTGKTFDFGTSDQLKKFGIPFEVETYYTNEVGDKSAITGNADDTRAALESFILGFDVAIVVRQDNEIDATDPKPILKFKINSTATDADATAPTASVSASPSLLSVTVDFSETVCTDEAGTILSGDVTDLFVVTSAGASEVTSATATEDGTQVVFVITNPGAALAANDYITYSGTLYDRNGNALANSNVAKVNGGATAWITV